jgi:hypothetical protein
MADRRSGDARRDRIDGASPPDTFLWDGDGINHSPGDVTPTTSHFADPFTPASPTDDQWNIYWSSQSRTESEYSFDSDTATLHALSRRNSESSVISQASATSYRWQGRFFIYFCASYMAISANNEYA